MPELALEQKEGLSGAGLRGVVIVRDEQPCFNIVASPTAAYLLPDILPTIKQVSFGADETRRPGGVLIVGDSVTVGRSVRDDDLLEQHRWNDLKQRLERLSGAAEAILALPQTMPSAAPALVVDEAHHALMVTPQAEASPAETTEPAIELLPADASIQALAAHLRELTGFSDARLAHLFKVTRETFNRWRLGAMTNPTPGTRRRVVTVTRLLEELAVRNVAVPDWLQNPTPIDGLTPYDLLSRGRVDEVAYLAAAVGGDMDTLTRDTVDEEPLSLEDDGDGWQTFDIEVIDDED